MRTFQVYKHPTLGYKAVKVGFNWPVFFTGLFFSFFNVVWMLICKLWGRAILWIALYFIIGVAAGMIIMLIDISIERELQDFLELLNIFQLLIGAGLLTLVLVPAFQGNKWVVTNLLKRGYELEDTLQAKTKDAAIAQSTK